MASFSPTCWKDHEPLPASRIRGSGLAARCCGAGLVTTRPATLTRRAHVRGIMEA